MTEKKFREEMLKIASDINSIVKEIKEEQKKYAEQEKTAEDFSLGYIDKTSGSSGGNPLLNFILS